MTRKPRRYPQTKGPVHPVIRQLREIRKSQHISQAKLARMLNCTRSKVEHCETGWLRNPSLNFVTQYAEALGVEITLSTPQDRESSLASDLR